MLQAANRSLTCERIEAIDPLRELVRRCRSFYRGATSDSESTCSPCSLFQPQPETGLPGAGCPNFARLLTNQGPPTKVGCSAPPMARESHAHRSIDLGHVHTKSSYFGKMAIDGNQS